MSPETLMSFNTVVIPLSKQSANRFKPTITGEKRFPGTSLWTWTMNWRVVLDLWSLVNARKRDKDYSLKSSEHALTCRSVAIPEQRDRILVAQTQLHAVWVQFLLDTRLEVKSKSLVGN